MLPHLHPPHALATQKSPLAGSPALKPAHDIAGTEIERGGGGEGRRDTQIQGIILTYETILSEYVSLMRKQGSKKINSLSRRSLRSHREVLGVKHNIEVIDIICHIHRNEKHLS